MRETLRVQCFDLTPMPRQARLTLPNVPWHIVQRGVNRGACFFGEIDYRRFLRELAERAKACAVQVHAYVLMTNHVHLLVTPSTDEGCALLMKGIGQTHTQFVNKAYRRSGTLWQGRYFSALVQSDLYLLACHRYIEENPVRAGMVRHPSEYAWSSYRANAEGAPSGLLTPHAVYQGLVAGENRAARLAAYRKLFDVDRVPGEEQAIRVATASNFAIGDQRFTDAVAATLGRRAVRLKTNSAPSV